MAKATALATLVKDGKKQLPEIRDWSKDNGATSEEVKGMIFNNPEKYGISVNKNGFFEINGKTPYYPGSKAVGKVDAGKDIDLSFINVHNSKNNPLDVQQSKSYEVTADGEACYATKREYTKETGETKSAWYLLEPVTAKQNQDGSIATEKLLYNKDQSKNTDAFRSIFTELQKSAEVMDAMLNKQKSKLSTQTKPTGNGMKYSAHESVQLFESLKD